jgi:hypothetical protein
LPGTHPVNATDNDIIATVWPVNGTALPTYTTSLIDSNSVQVTFGSTLAANSARIVVMG